MCNCAQRLERQVQDEQRTIKVNISRYGWSEFTVTPVRKDGEFALHNRYVSKDWNFCPFCGEKI